MKLITPYKLEQSLKPVIDRRKKYANKMLIILVGKYEPNGSYIKFNPEDPEHALFPKREIKQGTFNRKRERALKNA